ncbi:MAG: helix-turn-helix domain-containing protein [Candidatus Rifleibacteriota bacterium]
MNKFEKAYFTGLIESCRGKVGEAARRAGITPRALHQKLTRHQIAKEQFK